MDVVLFDGTVREMESFVTSSLYKDRVILVNSVDLPLESSDARLRKGIHSRYIHSTRPWRKR